MEDLHAIGGIPALMKSMLKMGLLHGDCLTVSGKTIQENLENIPELPPHQNIIFDIKNPIKPSGHLCVLFGNIATKGAIAKISGKEREKFSGEAIVFENKFECIEGIRQGKVKSGQVIVIRNEGASS